MTSSLPPQRHPLECHHGVDWLRVALGFGFALVCATAALVKVQSPAGSTVLSLLNSATRTLTAVFFVVAGATLGLRYAGREIVYREYLLRRLARLLPLFVLLLLFRAFGARGDFVFGAWLEAVGTLGYFPSAVASRAGSFASVGWLVGPLLQLYLVFPFIHRFTQTRGWIWVAGVLGIAVLGRFLAFSMGSSPADLNGWTTIGRLDQFVLGYVAALVFVRGRRIALIALGGILLGALGLAVQPLLKSFPMAHAEYREFKPLFLGVLASSALLAFLQLTSRSGRTRLAALVPVLYGAHLFLLPVLDAITRRGLRRIVDAPTANALLNAGLIVVPAALALGWLVRFAFETPLLAMIGQRREQAATAVAAAPIALEEAPAPKADVATPARSTNISYLPALDHLRGIAAVLVVAYHSQQGNGGEVGPNECRGPLWSFLLGGHSGVALFMVLSGFVFMHGAQGSAVNYWKFIYNRVLRVYPMFVLLLLITASTYRESLSGLAFFQSLVTLGNLPGAASYHNAIAGIGWTLAPEFQFYLLFPIIFAIMEQGRYAKWLLATFACLFALRALVYCIGNDLYDMVYWTLPGRLDQFLIGMLAARAYRRWGSTAWLFPVAVCCVVGLHHFARLHGPSIMVPGGPVWSSLVDMCHGLAWAFALVTYIPLANRLPRLLARPLAALGTISYSLYLLHYALLVAFNGHGWIATFVADRHLNALVIFAVIQLPFLLLAAALTYNIVEKPFLAMRIRYLSRIVT